MSSRGGKPLTLAPDEFSLSTFLGIESTIWWPKNVPIKCVAKMITLHSCDVENCEDTLVTRIEQEEI